VSAIIGLAVASDELRVVLVRDDTVAWAGRSGRSEEPALRTQIAALLAQVPVNRWRHPAVIAVVGPSGSQVKRITGLPPLENPRALAVVVREGAGRFFLKNGVPLDISGLRIVEQGAAWATAFDVPVLLEIAAGCRHSGHRLSMVAPSLAALSKTFPDSRTVWRDGDMVAEISSRGGELIAVRRIGREGGLAVEPLPEATPAALGRFGEDAWRFADAYGATMLAHSEPLAVRPVGASEEVVSRRRLRIAAVACVLSIALALGAPAAWSAIDSARTIRAINLLAPRARDAAVVEQDLRRMSGALVEEIGRAHV
jgi:hypothetical protein